MAASSRAPRGARDDGAQRVALAVLDAPREVDLALAREERHARELLEVGGNRVGGGVVADEGGWGGGVVTVLWWEYGRKGTVRSMRGPKRSAGHGCSTALGGVDLSRGKMRRVAPL